MPSLRTQCRCLLCVIQKRVKEIFGEAFAKLVPILVHKSYQYAKKIVFCIFSCIFVVSSLKNTTKSLILAQEVRHASCFSFFLVVSGLANLCHKLHELICSQCQHTKHQVTHYFDMTPHCDNTPAKFIFQSRICPFCRCSFVITHFPQLKIAKFLIFFEVLLLEVLASSHPLLPPIFVLFNIHKL